MEVSFTLWSVQNILEKIPFNSPVTENALHLDFSQLAVPYYVKNGFKVSIFYRDDSYPVDASCVIYLLIIAIIPLSEEHKKTNSITFEDVAKEALIGKNFFDTFHEKLTAFRELLAEKLFK
jgi:hypothetical protein